MSCVKVEVGVLRSPSLTVLMVSVDVKQQLQTVQATAGTEKTVGVARLLITCP